MRSSPYYFLLDEELRNEPFENITLQQKEMTANALAFHHNFTLRDVNLKIDPTDQFMESVLRIECIRLVESIDSDDIYNMNKAHDRYTRLKWQLIGGLNYFSSMSEKSRQLTSASTWLGDESKRLLSKNKDAYHAYDALGKVCTTPALST